MPTLQELTLAHSKRLSEVYRTRDVRLAEAQTSRDLQLRALAAAARAYQKYDDELAVRGRSSWPPKRRRRAQLSVITNETAEAEKEEFSRFRSELQKIKV